MIKVYVDGSFIAGKTGYGFAIVKDGNVVCEGSGGVDSDGSHRQVSGEIEAVRKAVKWCGENSVNEIEIYYDYEGVASWPLGKWKTNIDLTKKYAAFVRDSGIKIKWTKVKAHSGDRFNDLADKLAKKGATSSASPAAAPSSVYCAETFLQSVLSEGLSARLIHSTCYSRIEIYIGKDRIGMCDIYAKKNGEYSSDLRGFSDGYYKERIANLWNSFILGFIRA